METEEAVEILHQMVEMLQDMVVVVVVAVAIMDRYMAAQDIKVL